MPDAPRTEVSLIVAELKRVSVQWFKGHADKQVLLSASALIQRLSRYRTYRKQIMPSERDELLHVIHLMDQFIVSGKSSDKYVGSNLERRIHVLLETRNDRT